MHVDHELLWPELFEIRRDFGEIRLHDQRVLVVSAGALGILRRDLAAALGVEAARRVFRRFGFAHGYHDALTLRASHGWNDPLDGIRLGLSLYGLEGRVHSEVIHLEDSAPEGFRAEILWRHSYEAEQHVHHIGIAAEPACWTVAGYASGLASACLGRPVCFREVRCAAVSGSHCVGVGRDAVRWDADGIVPLDNTCAELGPLVEELHAAARRRADDEERRDRRRARAAADDEALGDRVEQYARRIGMVLASDGSRRAMVLAARVAPLDTNVLVCGESGTGKELVVRMIHEQSLRASGPFVSVNCAAFTDTLLESELFGHVRGAFTDAVRDKPGLLEIADAGTLFLVEIGEMSSALQEKVLRAVQEHEIRRVGSERVTTVNPRIVSATHRDLRAAVHAGTFREDLFYRLAAFVITVPPLRERREAIPELASTFLSRAASSFGKDVRTIAPDAMSALVNYPWPGNVRELRHTIDRAVIVAVGPRLTTRELPPELLLQDGGTPVDATFDLEQRERELIERALARFGGNRRRAAEALNISTVTLWRRIRRYGVRLPRGGASDSA